MIYKNCLWRRKYVTWINIVGAWGLSALTECFVNNLEYRDENDVSICEGDIVKTEKTRTSTKAVPVVGLVYFTGLKYCIRAMDCERYLERDADIVYGGDWKIIGNIHDNPQMVKVKFRGQI